MKAYTIGYGGRKPEEFLDLLRQNGVQAVVDVRLRPDRASMGVYAKAKTAEKGIERLLSAGGIKYYSLIELGNLFLDNENWRELYHELLENAGILLTRRLSEMPQPFCLMCAEKKVAECHRGVIAEYLEKRGWAVQHIE